MHKTENPHRPWRRVSAFLIAMAFSLVSFAPQSSLAATGVGSVVGQSATAAPTPGCTAVMFIGARGSGEKADKKEFGLGPELYGLYQQMAADLNNKLTVSPRFVAYPAASVDVLKLSKKEIAVLAGIPLLAPGLIAPAYRAFEASYIKNHLNVYLASIDTGIKLATDELTSKAKECPNARFVLGGYSQGALVMHEILLRLSDKNDAASQALLRRITATALIADPGKKSEAAAMQFGSADSSAQGIRSFVTLGERDVPTPSSTYDICNVGDIVCDSSWSVLLDQFVSGAGVNVHRYSYQNNQMVRSIGSMIATTLLQQLPGVVDHLEISPATATVPVGTPQAYSATAVDPLNKPLGDVTAGTTFGISPDGQCQGSVCTPALPGPHTIKGVMNLVSATATLN